MPIYTRTGDDGTTALFGGKRVLKSDGFVSAYGTIDEVTCLIGLLLTEVQDLTIQKFFVDVQADLFTIGGSIAGWQKDLGFLDARVLEMERRIDEYERKLPPLNNFILPGGSRAGSLAHLVRSVTRRAERQVVALSQKQKIDSRIIKYLNRLSDLFFELARYLNSCEQKKEIIWAGQRRK
ncbi:ATP:cob(I)alamin adenosyltransferase [Candidatus Gottesmanbacteria bacterium RBG_16_43_7]|uniref:Corrinoid adenosyltransferase n=1 Tax=Candidatus Gottesmanbacteria bacterium RBG_16_43_7 TaxID=1798373 RepID=A0A1F5Z889_9BACT|nr:MAG: ATP:cob(I)alamin adenosyltransferase [Candidatus Gottesmanbacteria bacterium RBG_16_43_7]